MKNLLLSLLVFVLFTSVSVSQETKLKKAKEQTKLSKGKDKKKGIYYGKLKFKPGVTKSNGKGKLNNPKGVILMIRDKSTKKIIARTTADGSGKFKFNNMAMRKGLELGWAFPQQVGGPITDENGCWVKLPSSPSPPLEPIEECDDSVMVPIRVGLSNCFNPPCPWEMKEKDVKLRGN